jgi:streptogramin lyase
VSAKPGNLYIAGNEGGDDPDVVRMNPKTGAVSPVAELPDAGMDESEGDHAAFGADGRLYVTDENLPGIFRVNVKTNDASLFSDDSEFEDSWALDVGPTGQLLVADIDAETIFGLKPPSPEANVLATNADDIDVEGIVGAPNGKIYGAEFDDPAGVLRIDPKAGTVEPLASFLGINNAESITVSPDSKTLYVSAYQPLSAPPVLLSYKPKSDTTRTLSDDPRFDTPWDLEVGFDGKLYVVDNFDGEVYRVNTKTGAVETVGDTGMSDPIGIAVQPPKCAGKFATVVGTNKKDKIKGSKGADIIAGLKGNDKIRGLKGKDRLCGGAGKDKLIGGPSRDKIKGGAGKDVEKQ